MLQKETGEHIDVSRLFIYYNARAKRHHAGHIRDTGCSITSAIETLQERGVCLESIWPYDVSSVNEQPSAEAYEHATEHQITEALQVNINLHEMKSCLAQGFPFAFGLILYQSFDKAAKHGVVPMPNDDEQGRGEHGRSD